MSDQKIRVGITHGDINGIGYEVIIKSLSDQRICDLCTPIVYGSSQAASFYRKQYEGAENFSFNIISKASEANPKRANLINCISEEIKIEPGVSSISAGASSVSALNAAVADLKAGYIDVIVTAPISKENVQSEQFKFTGHTEFFASNFEGQPLMIMCSDMLKVGLVTIHIPISEVSSSISSDKILNSLRLLRQTLIRDFSIREPRIAVLGLNPHAGDGGLIGNEEQNIIIPAIKAANQERILAFGPFAADGFFASASYTKYDAVLAMYHDQGLAPFKALTRGGVNFTAGISVVRTSPAHGVGFDIAGGDAADESAMRDSIYLAIDVVRSRRIYAKISANPLQTYKRESGKDVSVMDLPDQD